MGGSVTLPPGRSNLGTDLGNDHPVSFTYDTSLATQNGELNDPTPLLPANHPSDVSLDKTGMLHCTACHDPHDDTFGKFLVKDNKGSALCITCHDKNYWTASDHRNSGKTWNNSGTDPWPNSAETTVADNACGSCHTPHDAGSSQRLLNYANEENNCYPCHNGNVAAKNIQAEFAKTYTHPIASTTGDHDPTEDPVNPPARHVECVDCHNPHAAKNQAASAPAASGALAGVAGINTGGSLIDPVSNEYELCFRCHADSIDRGSAHINRQFPQTNTRLEFSSSSASYHPVTTIGKNPDVPSLISPYNTSSLIYCTDCHNNNSTTGPNGPHGSTHQVLLERNVRFTDGASDSTSVYALYKGSYKGSGRLFRHFNFQLP